MKNMSVMDRLKLLKQDFGILLEHVTVAHTNNFFCSLDVFLVFDKEYLMSSLSEPATDRNLEEQLL